MSSLLKDAIGEKVRKGMTVDGVYDVYGIDLRPLLREIRDELARKRTCWPEERKATVSELWGKGLSIAVIASEVGMSKKATEAWIFKHRDLCPYRRKKATDWTQERVSTVTGMWRDGKGMSEIATTIGVSYGTLKHWVRRNRDLCPARGVGRARRTREDQS